MRATARSGSGSPNASTRGRLSGGCVHASDAEVATTSTASSRGTNRRHTSIFDMTTPPESARDDAYLTRHLTDPDSERPPVTRHCHQVRRPDAVLRNRE